jgi:hypothetical protein
MCGRCWAVLGLDVVGVGLFLGCMWLVLGCSVNREPNRRTGEIRFVRNRNRTENRIAWFRFLIFFFFFFFLPRATNRP